MKRHKKSFLQYLFPGATGRIFSDGYRTCDDLRQQQVGGLTTANVALRAEVADLKNQVKQRELATVVAGALSEAAVEFAQGEIRPVAFATEAFDIAANYWLAQEEQRESEVANFYPFRLLGPR
jgi:hypothetical protein